jgi:hypothetical protein
MHGTTTPPAVVGGQRSCSISLALLQQPPQQARQHRLAFRHCVKAGVRAMAGRAAVSDSAGPRRPHQALRHACPQVHPVTVQCPVLERVCI